MTRLEVRAVRTQLVVGTVVVTSIGWLVLAVAYLLVLPLLGVISPVTWATTWAGWLVVLVVPAGVTAWLVAVSTRVSAACVATLLIPAAVMFGLMGLPSLTVDGHFAQHRADLAQLAAEYGTGQAEQVQLPWRMRHLSIDGHAHYRCGFTDPRTGDQPCALYLPLWQNWRAESGFGIAYYAQPPGPDASIATASGDIGAPSRDLGDGWWLVGIP